LPESGNVPSPVFEPDEDGEQPQASEPAKAALQPATRHAALISGPIRPRPRQLLSSRRRPTITLREHMFPEYQHAPSLGPNNQQLTFPARERFSEHLLGRKRPELSGVVADRKGKASACGPATQSRERGCGKPAHSAMGASCVDLRPWTVVLAPSGKL